MKSPLGSSSRGRKTKNFLATVLLWGTGSLALIPLGFVLYFVFAKGMGVVDLGFLTKDIPISRSLGGGMGPAVVGTLLITASATLMAVPLGILGAVYLVEYGDGKRLARLIRLMSDVMTGVPSIVMGLFIYTIWVLRFKQSGFAGALALAALMLPIVIRSSEEMLRLVPTDLRQASYALGATKSRTALSVILPTALPGITSGALLAVARAAGETAPLLFTIGIVSKINLNLISGTNTALSVQIFRNAQLPFPAAQDRAWGAALTLIVVVLAFSLAARLITGRFQRV